jgi:hypothetical protein
MNLNIKSSNSRGGNVEKRRIHPQIEAALTALSAKKRIRPEPTREQLQDRRQFLRKQILEWKRRKAA